MKIDRSKLLERAENAKGESKYLDFKRQFDAASAAEWCEVIKDVVAFANSGGGVIVFGVNNDGTIADVDVSSLLKIDIADITNKIEAYCGYQFAEIEIIEVSRDSESAVAFLIGAADIPLVFTRAGADVLLGGKQRPAFVKGTVYFRHGAKSEPATRDDLVSWLDRTIDEVRRSWLGGIRKVVEAPPGHVLSVVSSPLSNKSGVPQAKGMAITAEMSAGPGAVRMVPQNAEELWPHRQKELLEAVNKAIKAPRQINGHDILCINTHLNVLKAHPEFAYKPHRRASPQYSDEYVRWIVLQYGHDPKFFDRMREEYKGS